MSSPNRAAIRPGSGKLRTGKGSVVEVVEFMVGGASSIVLSGDFVRVPVGVPYAYRNAGDSDARLLCRTASPQTVRRAASILGSYAA